MPESAPASNRPRTKSSKRLVIILLVCAVFMFGFGYALVPLYNVLCQKLGFNGKTSGMVAPVAVSAVDESRTITVQFLATNNANLPWKFHPYRTSIEVHPGENAKIAYFAKNLSDHPMTVQAVPSVSPGVAAKYLKKTECFCFAQQTLNSNESMDMPLLFHLDRDLPKDVKTVTLAYTLFDVTGMKKTANPDEIGKIK
ncbi:MAG TPA: cytochrome c oxidase assembly protein [Gammaproteobacteria bacterium]|nr:cytochrome c oxidase assembly protein [Gammaproteobacteria bacterium]